jgi:hypothetical protein
VGALAVGDRIVLASADGTLELLDAASGAPAGRSIELGRALSLPPVALGNRLLIATTDGSLHLLGLTLDEWASEGIDSDPSATTGTHTPADAGDTGP